MTSAMDRLLVHLLSTPEIDETFGSRAFVQAMLDVEAALARVQGRLGLIPQASAETIAVHCDAEQFDLDALAEGTAKGANPALPQVEALTALLPDDAARHVHWGATSQDIVDTALMLLARRGLDHVGRDLERLSKAAAALALTHRETLMVGRTLLQHALPMPFGLKAARWLSASEFAIAGLDRIGLSVQFGGAAGTLAALGDHGLDVMAALGDELGLAVPDLPWHAERGPIVELGSALIVACGVAGKIALDVALLMQTEVGEVFEPPAPGKGGSSTMPHKRNPVCCAAVLAALRQAQSCHAALVAASVHEHERAAGAWQAEWTALSDLFRRTAGAVFQAAAVLEGLEVDARRMRENLDRTNGLVMAEAVVTTLAQAIGKPAAQRHVRTLCEFATVQGKPLRDIAAADPLICEHIGQDIDRVFDPAEYLGGSSRFIDRALAGFARRQREMVT